MIIQTEYQTFTPKQEYLKFEPNKSFVISVASRAELIIFVIIYNLLFKKNKHFEGSCELLRFDAFALPELAAFVARSNLFIIQV